MSAIPRAVADLVHERAQGHCERCGRYGPLQLHHRLFRSSGGAHTAGNIIGLCGSGNHTACHGFAHSGRAAEKDGYKIRSRKEADPTIVPVKVAAPGFKYMWVLLDNWGNKTYLPTDEAIERLIELGIRWDSDQ